jgi:hypothetical protein
MQNCLRVLSWSAILCCGNESPGRTLRVSRDMRLGGDASPYRLGSNMRLGRDASPCLMEYGLEGRANPPGEPQSGALKV